MGLVSKIDVLIIWVLNIPRIDVRTIIRAARRFASGGYGVRERAPKVSVKRSLLAWTLMVVFRESPSLFFLGMFCLLFFIPFFFFVHLFS